MTTFFKNAIAELGPALVMSLAMSIIILLFRIWMVAIH